MVAKWASSQLSLDLHCMAQWHLISADKDLQHTFAVDMVPRQEGVGERDSLLGMPQFFLEVLQGSRLQDPRGECQGTVGSYDGSSCSSTHQDLIKWSSAAKDIVMACNDHHCDRFRIYLQAVNLWSWTNCNLLLLLVYKEWLCPEDVAVCKTSYFELSIDCSLTYYCHCLATDGWNSESGVVRTL